MTLEYIYNYCMYIKIILNHAISHQYLLLHKTGGYSSLPLQFLTVRRHHVRTPGITAEGIQNSGAV